MKKTQKQKGFTLLEVLLYVAIISMVLSAVVFFAWNVLYGGVKSGRLSEVNYAARYASERIQYEIRNSSGITVASSNFGANLASAAGTKITLTNASAAKNPTIIDVSSGQLRLTVGANAPVNLTPINISVTNLTFTNNSSGDNKTRNLSFTFSVQSNIPSAGNVYQNVTLESAAEIRGN